MPTALVAYADTVGDDKPWGDVFRKVYATTEDELRSALCTCGDRCGDLLWRAHVNLGRQPVMFIVDDGSEEANEPFTGTP